ncbi:MAG: cyclic 2,3-diphosphoglycerate synthetase [Gaiellaceae bacterium]
MRALALVDGEHYPDVVADTLAALPYDVVGAVMLGGTEKLREGGPDFGVSLWNNLAAALVEVDVDVVVDLSDEPVVGPSRRFRLASRALANGIPYVGADFTLDPVRFAPYAQPALAVIGTGKRVGKTAVAGHVARLLSRSRDVVVVAMGRGGPAEPVVMRASPSVEDLLALSRSGSHAASDYLEDAALAGVATVGARRCGGGLAGQPFASNVEEAAQVAASLEPDLVLLEGSGAAIPPVEARGRVLVVGAHQQPDAVVGYLGAYRLLLSDLVVLTMCEEPLATPEEVEALREAVAGVDPDLTAIATVLRPRPMESVAGKRVAFFSTAPAAIHAHLREHLEREHRAEVVFLSGSLADRSALLAELDSPSVADAEVFLTEIKAAAIDVVAEAAETRGVGVVFADNEVLPLPGEPDLDDAVSVLADNVIAAGSVA